MLNYDYFGSGLGSVFRCVLFSVVLYYCISVIRNFLYAWRQIQRKIGLFETSNLINNELRAHAG